MLAHLMRQTPIPNGSSTGSVTQVSPDKQRCGFREGLGCAKWEIKVSAANSSRKHGTSRDISRCGAAYKNRSWIYMYVWIATR